MNKRVRITLFIVVLLGVVMACSIPSGEQTIPQGFPTLDQTMTALFSQATLLTPNNNKQSTPMPPVASLTPIVEIIYITATPSGPTQTSTMSTTDPTRTITRTATKTTQYNQNQYYTYAITYVAASITPTSLLPWLIPTKTYTPTITPTITATGPTIFRTGGSYEAKFFSPGLDGSLEEWSNTVYPASYVVYGQSEWSGSSDLNSSFRAAWNNQYLFLGVKVVDDVYAQRGVGDSIYLGDYVELLLDADLYGDFSSSSMSIDDYQIGFSPGNTDINGFKEAVIWYPRAMSGSRSDILIYSTASDGAYRIEVAIPWGTLGINNPSGNMRIGFTLSVSDNDSTTDDVQQTMISSNPNRNFTQPTTWGELKLIE